MSRRDRALDIWQAGVSAVRADVLMRRALSDMPLAAALLGAPRVIVVGAGKAGASMAAAFEGHCAESLSRVEGHVNVPNESVQPLRAIHLHGARPVGTNEPTSAGIAGSRRILELIRSAGRDDVGICLLSGGGSALLPAPVVGITLEDKQFVTRLLHASGVTIAEMNAVRKHLSAVKGGRLAETFGGKMLFSLIISDVVGDPIDVIASGPTTPDPTTFADARAVLERYQLISRVPASVKLHMDAGAAGNVAETPKKLPANVVNRIIGNNAMAVAAAALRAEALGYRVVNLGSFVEGETRDVALAFAGMVRGIIANGTPASPPLCLLVGGETTVTLGSNHGLGGRNQEFVLAALAKLARDEMARCVILSGGTDGEDGPTDAAGAIADIEVWENGQRAGLDAMDFLRKHDAYHFFDTTGGLLKTGITGTNVMDVRLALIE